MKSPNCTNIYEMMQNAIASDGRCSIATAEAEYRLTMDGIKKFHSSLNSKRMRLRRVEDDSSSLRLAMGLVAIRPSSHSRLYSTLIPLAAALAAGNCILLEVGVPSIKKQIYCLS